MTITVPLTVEEEARLDAIARNRGLSTDVLVQTLVREVLSQAASADAGPERRPQDRETQLNDLLDFLDAQETSPEVSEAAFHRENWYR